MVCGGARPGRDLGREIHAALADPVLQLAMSRGMRTLRERRAVAWETAERFEQLRDQARTIKEEALVRRTELLEQFCDRARAAGAIVVEAADARAATEYIAGLAVARGIRLAVKSKSMTSEEVGLNPCLEAAGVTVVEGDLGERIIQLACERPSHLVAPAIHKTREEIIQLLSDKMHIAEPPRDPEGLTRLVREDLRAAFLGAGMGVTGANFAIAETGSIVLVENEGNICLTSQMPPIHVALVGREKVIPRLSDLGVFLDLLPRSATGQKLSSYVSLITGRQRSPLPGREFHVVILDNGRSAAAEDADLKEALYCLRCGACLNACAPYNLVGGHVYGGDPYPGGIGCAWTYLTKGHGEAGAFNGLCTTCSRCTEVCPVKIDIPWLNTVIKERNHRDEGLGLRERVFARADLLGKVAGPVAPLANAALAGSLSRAPMRALKVDPSRRLPRYERETLTAWWGRRSQTGCATRRATEPEAADPLPRLPAAGPVSFAPEARPGVRTALFVDCFTNHNLPQVGKAVVAVLEAAGIEVILAHNSCCGRPALSQGILDQPRRWAVENLDLLLGLISRGYDIVCIEPSCLSALRDDYGRLLEGTPYAGDPHIRVLAAHCYDVTEYLTMLARDGRLALEFPAAVPPETYVVHGHCHQKMLGFGSAPAELLRLLPGATVIEVEALCCGMVGSFGYKREFSELSLAIGQALFDRLNRHNGTIVACGISCRSQIEAGTGRKVVHPVEVIAAALERARRSPA
jgi:iron-sulfur cluster protein